MPPASRDGAAAESGARAARDDRLAAIARDLHDRAHVARRRRQHDAPTAFRRRCTRRTSRRRGLRARSLRRRSERIDRALSQHAFTSFRHLTVRVAASTAGACMSNVTGLGLVRLVRLLPPSIGEGRLHGLATTAIATRSPPTRRGFVFSEASGRRRDASIARATKRLLTEMTRRNQIELDDIASVLFSRYARPSRGFSRARRARDGMGLRSNASRRARSTCPARSGDAFAC